MTSTSSSLNTSPRSVSRSQPLRQDRTDAYSLLIGHVRDIREEARNLRQYAEELKSKVSENHVDITEVKVAWQAGYTAMTDHASPAVKQHIEALKTLENVQPALYRRDGYEITIIEHEWERVVLKWPTRPENEQPLDVGTMLTQITEVDSVLCEVIVHTEKLTLPDLVNSQLKMMRVGQTIDFLAEYSDELPTVQAQVAALNYLHDHPLMVKGVVDVENGLIYCASPSPLRRLLSHVLIALSVILGAAIVYILYQLHVFPTKSPVEDFLKAYLAVMIGGFAHLVVSAVKQSRTSKGKTFTVLGDWLLWIHVKEVPILTSILTLFIGFLSLVFLGLGIDLWTAFFAGYSVDSVIDLFLMRFTNVSSTRIDTLKKQLAQTAQAK